MPVTTLLIDGRDLYSEMKRVLGNQPKKIDFEKFIEKAVGTIGLERDEIQIIYVNTLHRKEFRPNARSSQLRFYSFLRDVLKLKTVLVEFEYAKSQDEIVSTSSFYCPKFLAYVFEVVLQKHRLILMCSNKRYHCALRRISKYHEIELCSTVTKDVTELNDLRDFYSKVHKIENLEECLFEEGVKTSGKHNE